jgi:hypothetical protein
VYLSLEPLALLLQLVALAADLGEMAAAGFDARVLGVEQGGEEQQQGE